jgi:membrane associated rhomboid family serine protease
MPQTGQVTFSFPAFKGAARGLVLSNLVAYFLLLLVRLAFREWAFHAVYLLGFVPGDFLYGRFWQPFTYSFIHTDLSETLFGLLFLWLFVGLLERYHESSWVMGLYASTVLGTALCAALLYSVSGLFGYPMSPALLIGTAGGGFGIIIAIGVLHGDLDFMLFPLPITMKARYLAAIFAIVSFALLFGDQKLYAFAELGGALVGLLYARFAPRRGVTFPFSESLYAVRNRFYRWKRRRAARKFEVYMKRQGRTVRLDGQGRQIDDDHNDKKRWN